MKNKKLYEKIGKALVKAVKIEPKKLLDRNKTTIVIQKDKSKPYRSIYFKKEYDDESFLS